MPAYVAVEIDATQAIARLQQLAQRVGGGLGQDWAGPAVSAEIATIEREWFATEGKGTWAQLSARTVYMREHRLGSYRRAPGVAAGSAHPILQWSGDLAASLGDPRGRGSAWAVIRMAPTVLEQGTSLPYAIYHESTAPRSRLPRRPVIAQGQWVEDRLAGVWRQYVLAEDRPAGAKAGPA